MKKKSRFNPDDINRSHILHEFISIHQDFIQSVSHTNAEIILHFLKDKEKSKSLIHHALFNPHPETHDSIQDDLENAIISLESWISGKVKAEVPLYTLKILKDWITEQ